MNFRKDQFLNLGFNLVFWIILFTYIMAVRYYDIDFSFLQIEINVPLLRILGNGLVLGILIGSAYSLMEAFLKRKNLYQHSLVFVMISRALIHFILTALLLTLVSYLNYYLDTSRDAINPQEISFFDYLLSTTIVFLFIGAFLGNLVISMFRTLQMKIGEDVFFDLLIGKFKPAKEEDRAYLFIDLKSSTTIAEKLGHEKYSYFIQDCFQDLHSAVVATKAEVYQYVGDEAILTWTSDQAIKNSNCINAFFEFEKTLNYKREFYKEMYGEIPVFKAGLNMGKVMTAEVGVIKREIAYHSDVLNTAARIQGLCNEKNARLLISEIVLNKLTDIEGFEVDQKGAVLLKGKSETVEVYEIKKL